MDLFRYFSDALRSLFGNQLVVKLAILFLPFLLREKLYQSVVTYRIERMRGFQPTLTPVIEQAILAHREVFDRKLDSKDKIIHAALKVTADFLTFNGDSTDKIDPLSIYQSEAVNSTSFAAFFSATTQYLLQKNNLSDQYICQQYMAKRLQNGINLSDRYRSPYGGSSFKSERDIVALIDRKTGEKYFVDPTLFEQTSIVSIHVEGYDTPSVSKTSAHISER